MFLSVINLLKKVLFVLFILILCQFENKIDSMSKI